MPDLSPLLDDATLDRLDGLALRARWIVEGHLAGMHRGPYGGFSAEFADHREYAPGDDPRRLDWKVFARTNKYYLKQFEEETNLVCHLLIDASGSMGYRSRLAPMSKLDYARRAAAALAYLVLHQQDGAGLAAFDGQLRRLVPASGNPAQLREILDVLESLSAEGKTAVGPILHELAERLKRRGVVFVLSDLLDDADTVLAGLKQLRRRRHEVVVLHVLDPAELDFPFDRLMLFRGLESLPDQLADAAKVRAAYLDEFNRFRRKLEAGCRAFSIDYVPMRTDRPLGPALAGYLASRS